MEDAFIIEGGIPLKGSVKLTGAKNVALKIIIAALLFDTSIILRNIPKLSDIQELLHLISKLGAETAFTDTNTLLINGSGLKHNTVDLLHGSKIRVSFMLFAPLLHRFGEAIIPNPGGCRLGARPIDRHVKLLEAFNVNVEYESSTGYYLAKLNGSYLNGADYTFEKPSHTGTELAIMLGVLARGRSAIHNAALEPEIDDLIAFLNKSGGQVRREGRTIHVDGVESLHLNDESYTIMCDRLTAAAYGVFAIASKGDIEVNGLDPKHIKHFSDKVIESGGGYEEDNHRMRFYYKEELRAVDITTAPHPEFSTDIQGPWAVLMTQARGVSTIHETVFENRFGYVDELRRLGAHIEFFQPEVKNPHEVYQFNISRDHDVEEQYQGIKITGPTALHNGVLKVTDIRAGASLVIAACIAKGESVVLGASIIDRGYESIEKTLHDLGARIKRV